MNIHAHPTQPTTVTRISHCREGKELHIIIYALSGDAPSQIAAVERAAGDVVSGLPGQRVLFRRWYLSDPANQEALLPLSAEPMSVVGQAPLASGCKAALWLWLRSDDDEGGREIFMTGLGAGSGLNACAAAEGALTDCFSSLRQGGDVPAEACHRTWLFVRDIDLNYAGVVEGRNNMFEREGLTTDTHFIASTGIGAVMADTSTVMTMDAYAVAGRQPRVRYLYAAERLNRTSDYGVAFERGVSLDFGRRKLVFISGTASIDNKGLIVCPGDVVGQFERMVGNIEALLAEAACTEADICQATVYLRDPADAPVVECLFEQHYGNSLPRLIVLAPVCRPGWLVEMECIALR